MRILRLDLVAFGSFSNARLDFSHKPNALQLIYGPNEAGKSTTLRALLALLYGVPPRTSDAHLHDMARLRIGATLQDERGKQVSIVRRKGLKQTLLDDNGQPVADDALVELLGGLDETLFRNMFGLDHERLREGAEELLKGGGHVGEGLFDASLGSRALRDLKESLNAEADELYKQRGKSPKLNQALESLREKMKQKREAALSPTAFVEQQRALLQKREERTQLLAQRRELLTEQARARRMLQLLPLLARHDTRKAQLSLLSTSRAASTASATMLGTDLLEEQIRELERRYGVVLSGEAEGPERRSELAALERELELVRVRLGVINLPTQPIDTPLRTRLRKLAGEHQRECERIATLSESLRGAQRESEQLSQRAMALQAGESLDALVALLAAIDSERIVEGMQQREREHPRLRQQLERSLQQLGLSCELPRLASLGLPEERTLLAIERELDERKVQRAAARVREGQLRDKARELAVHRAALLSRGGLVREAELLEARDSRDRTLTQLQQERVSAHLLSEQLGRLREQQQLADQLADRMRREAREASDLHRLESELALLEQELQQLAEQELRRSQEEAQLLARLELLIGESGLPLRDVSELRPRLLKLAALRERALELAADEAVLAALQARARDYGSQLVALLEPPAELAAAPLAELLAHAKLHLQRHEEQQREARALGERAREARAREAALGGAIEEAKQRAMELDLRFRNSVSELGIQGALSADELFACFDDMSRCFELERKAESVRARERELAELREALVRDVSMLAHKVEREGQSLSLGEQLESLARAQRSEREARRDHAQLVEELRQLDQELLALGDGESIELLRERASQHDASSLRARLSEIESSLSAQDEELSRLEQELGRLDAGLLRLSQAPFAVELAEEVEAELGGVRALLRRYLEVRLSQAILAREIERFRSEHQTPLLARTAELFTRLTLRNYTGLGVEFDERDEPVLCAVHKSERRIRIAGLSDGTRDQLYLALRIASIERFLGDRRSLPLVLDDAFIHFDDARAEAALSVLGELTRRTQVLFFTHHARMIELAKRALRPAHVAIHELDPVRGTVNYRDDGPLFARV